MINVHRVLTKGVTIIGNLEIRPTHPISAVPEAS